MSVRVVLLACMTSVFPAHAQESQTVSRFMNMLLNGKRVEALSGLEDLFSRSKGQDKNEVAEILSTAFEGETREDPGYYSDFLLASSGEISHSEQTPTTRLRHLRLAGDYCLKKFYLDRARSHYEKLLREGGPDDKDYADYKMAWLDLNLSKYEQAIERLVNLLRRSPESKLKHSVVFDLGRFWGEAPNVSLQKEVLESLLGNLELKENFFRGLHKTLLLPKTRSAREKLKDRAAQFTEAHLLIEQDLETMAPTKELACEKLYWRHMPSALSKIESMAPYDTLKQCLDDPSGYERKIDARLRDNILVFLSHLKAYSPEMSLHKAQIYSRLNEYSLACQEYSKSISSVVESQSPICEDSLEVCYLSLRQHKALRKQSPSAPFSFLVLGDGLSCAKKDRSSASLKLAAQLFEESREEFKVFFLDPTRRPEIAASLLPDLVYEMSADLKDEAFVRELAKHFLFSENPYSDSRELRQANFERYIASSAALSAEEAEFILTRYSPKESEDTETLDSERLNTLVLAAEKSLPGSPLYQVVQKLCLDSKLQSRRPKPLINYCQNHSEIAVAWRWIDLSSLSCQDHRVLVEMTWDLLDTTPELDLGSSYAQSFLSAVRLAYLKGDYDRAAILLARGCSPDHVLVENLKMMHDLRLETSRSPASLSQFIKRIQFLEKQTKRIQGLKAFNATTQKALQKQFYDLLVSTEEAMGQIAAKDTRVASRLEEFRSLFETWKKGVE